MSSLSKAYVSKLLTNVSIAYMNAATDFVWNVIAPFSKVEKDSGKILSYGKQALRFVDTERAIGGGYNEVKFDASITDHYLLQDFGLSTDLLDEEVENAETPMSAEIDTTEMLTQQFLVNQEKRIIDIITNTSNVGTNIALSGTSLWTNAASNPLKDIQTAIDAVRAKTGKYPNKMLLSYDSMSALTTNPAILARFNVALGAPITTAMIEKYISELFSIKTVRVVKTQYVANNLGQTDTLTAMMSNKALVFYSEDNPTQKSTTFMRTYAKRNGHEVRKLNKSQLGRDGLARGVYAFMVVNHKLDHVVVDKDNAYLFTATVS